MGGPERCKMNNCCCPEYPRATGQRERLPYGSREEGVAESLVSESSRNSGHRLEQWIDELRPAQLFCAQRMAAVHSLRGHIEGPQPDQQGQLSVQGCYHILRVDFSLVRNRTNTASLLLGLLAVAVKGYAVCVTLIYHPPQVGDYCCRQKIGQRSSTNGWTLISQVGSW